MVLMIPHAVLVQGLIKQNQPDGIIFRLPAPNELQREYTFHLTRLEFTKLDDFRQGRRIRLNFVTLNQMWKIYVVVIRLAPLWSKKT